jgi:hypothetical protein
MMCFLDWRELIGDDVFEYHTNNAESHAEDDLFENDITGIDVSVINKVPILNLLQRRCLCRLIRWHETEVI